MPESDDIRIPITECPRCNACQQQDRAPQGETVRLFEPAPVQMPGQIPFGPEVSTGMALARSFEGRPCGLTPR
jgi:hypothetical protein